jgi:non-ribosomal peptide synthetase-like protein
MAVNFSAWSIRHPLPPLVIAAALVAIGYLTFSKLPITQLPNVDVPVISVTITQFGAAPAELESQVTKTVEDAVSGIEGAHHITSSVTDGISSTTVTFRLDTNTDRALNDVKDAVSRVRANFPRTVDEPVIQRVDIAGLPILTYAAISPGKTPEQLSWFVEDVVIRALQGVRGVARVERIGSVEREIRVALDPVRLQALGLTALDVSRQLRGSNVDLAGGRAEIGGRDQAIRTLAGARTVVDLAATRIALPTGGEVRLDDLGLVSDTIAEPRTFARFDGTPVVGFSILRSKGASDVVVADAVAAQAKAIMAANPDVELKLIDSSVGYTLGNYHAALHTLYEGAALAVLVIFLFLRDLRATVITAVTLPLSILPALWVMDVLGFSLNMVTLLAITLSTGILVDDAIVEVENIARHIRAGKSPYRAALEAADEIGLAVIAISLTIVAIFVPASFMQSVPGQFFKQFGITVSVQVLFSLLVARFITPMLAAYLLRPREHASGEDGFITRTYTRLVTWSIRHRFITIITGLLLFLASIWSATLLPSGFLPDIDKSRSLLAIELPPGSLLSDTEAVTEAIAARVRSRPEVVSVFIDGGRIPPTAFEVRKAALTINYTPKSDRSRSQSDLETDIMRDLATIPDIRYWFLDENGKRDVTFIVTGQDDNTVANVASELAAQMQRLPSVTNVVSTARLNRPELRIYPRRDLAVRLGISTESLSETIRVATIGDVGPALAKFDAGDRLVPIRVLLEDGARGDRQTLEQIRVPSPRGGGVPLIALADVRFAEGPISINRYDRQRQAVVEADLFGTAALSEALAAVKALPMMKGLPQGVTIKEAGDAELQAELFDGFGSAMRNGLLMVYVVLAVLFGGLLQPLTILISLPLALGGAILALLVTDRPISAPVVIGILMLMGIVTKNAIMLVDFAIAAMRKGVDRASAIIDAGRMRARPIVMTTIAMAAGMAPSALAFGTGGEFRSPMAIAVIGGLLVSTLLSLLFVPAMFTLMDDVGLLTARVFGGFIGEADEPEPAPRTIAAKQALLPEVRAPALVDDRSQILVRNDVDNTVRWKEGERLEQLFEQRCDQVPADHLAIIAEDVSLTFRELDNRANQAARYLLDQGLKAGDRVALLFEKTVHRYVALLAVLKIGAAYVPIDASFPTDRIAFILEDAEVKAIVSESRFRAKLEELSLPPVFLDTAEKEINAKAATRLAADEKTASSDQLFYVIYTSGTTGKPKGVAIEHAGICNFVKVAGEVYGIGEGDRCYQAMTLAFDFHVEDLWVPLIAGGTLVVGKPGSNLFGNDLYEYLLRKKVTVLPCVPTLWATIEKDLPDVRVVLLSGESVPHNLVVRWHRPGRSILNAYGPTECSVSSTLRILVPENPVTIGAPLPTYTVVILDENKDELAADGATGEIGIAGVGLALGYLNREELTKQKFIPDFLSLPNNPSGRIYRSGDLGCIRGGELEFHGRIDTQVKIRGYRIELEEIEAVLLQLPQISQAVVNPYEAEPGAVDIVAYYTRKQGAPEVSLNEVSETLRKNLPPYMVPGYFEELDVIPMTSNNKADRKNLPAPKGPRFSVSSNKYVAPTTDTQKTLVGALTEVMKIERASIEDNFFQDLGAHSLLMARFGAEIRKRLKISAVSMQDIYLNPTIEKLAGHIDSLPAATSSQANREIVREAFHVPSNFSYYGCGTLQLIWYLGWSAVALWVFVAGIRWTYAAMPDLTEVYLRVVELALGLFVVFSLLPIVLKWVLIGRWKPQSIPIWSLRYFRFWAVKTLIRSAPMAMVGGPIYNLYLRLLGAKLGANTVIQSQLIPVCTDLISIGPNSILRQDSIILGYKAQSNYIHMGPIRIGANAFVGEASVIDINTTMEDGTQLGNSSSLHEGQTIPKGKRYDGSPARETTADYCQIEPRACGGFRRAIYALLPFVIGFATMPFPVLFAYSWFPEVYQSFVGVDFPSDVPRAALLLMSGKVLALSFVSFFVAVALGVLNIGVVPRLLNLFLRKDRTYILYGVHYFLQQSISALSNSEFYNRLFGDSCGVVRYMGWVGWNLNTIVQTGSNFGEDQKHDNPFLCDIGSGTMVSDGFMMVNTTMSNSSFRLGMVKIGDNNYLGNYIRYPHDGKTGVNCLIGTKTLVPIDGPVRENVGLLGSPCFEIPRAVDRDKQMSQNMDEATRKQRLRAKNRYNFVTAILFLLKTWFLVAGLALSAAFALVYYPRYGMLSVAASAAFAFVFTIFWNWFIERASLGFGWLSPQISLVLDKYYWFHERHWHLFGLTLVANWFAGTPFKNLISRLEGVKMGKKVFDDGIRWTEYSLLEIGDYANFNTLSILWPHSLEEGVFKSDRIKLGVGCTLGAGSLTHYGVTMGDHVVLEVNSYLMKGEIMDAYTTWRGNPARAVGDRVVSGTDQRIEEAFVPAKVA